MCGETFPLLSIKSMQTVSDQLDSGKAGNEAMKSVPSWMAFRSLLESSTELCGEVKSTTISAAWSSELEAIAD